MISHNGKRKRKYSSTIHCLVFETRNHLKRTQPPSENPKSSSLSFSPRMPRTKWGGCRGAQQPAWVGWPLP